MKLAALIFAVVKFGAAVEAAKVLKGSQKNPLIRKGTDSRPSKTNRFLDGGQSPDKSAEDENPSEPGSGSPGSPGGTPGDDESPPVGIYTDPFSDPCACDPEHPEECDPPDASTISNIEDSMFVAYCNGYEVFGSCGEDCCTPESDESCIGLKSWVRKGTGSENKSCDGMYACFGAVVPLIANSCIGYSACEFAGYSGGAFGQLISSCQGGHSCAYARDSGSVGNLVESCVGNGSCYELAANGGVTSNLENSCIGESACEGVAANGGILGDINFSCCGDGVCEGFCNDPADASYFDHCAPGWDWENVFDQCSATTTTTTTTTPAGNGNGD